MSTRMAAGVNNFPCFLTFFIAVIHNLYLFVYFFVTVTGEPHIYTASEEEWCQLDLMLTLTINY